MLFFSLDVIVEKDAEVVHHTKRKDDEVDLQQDVTHHADTVEHHHLYDGNIVLQNVTVAHRLHLIIASRI